MHLGVPWDKLQVYIITERGIEANLDKISTIADMGHVRNIKYVQWLMGCLADLSHFISWLGEHGLPQYMLLKKFDSFHWMEETQKALDELKALITKLSVLASSYT
jgi:hypothetical protein